ncbi:small GTP-binding protein [Scytonema sp. HK-05]|uniref:Rab family GTPase n=1 Tax=Scytonema sp. HK-05 TaxID=1137095 RepID=UPI000936D042|nr:Rab family GTPase [Scytonema sp. HK-05]OKH58511.1 GTP-binding protein [Scytonema sp. HK-05]BAY47013.1 small GTP-binding protein [Scytonema sp. HK-05]
MLQKKICMVGAFATGKTSLVSRFVNSIFSDKYQTTVGVKIDKKTVNVGDKELNLILWDLYGEDDFQKVRMSYLRGSSGYLLVVDATRHNTLEKAFNLQNRVEETIGQVPFILVINKSDLADEWEISNSEIDELRQKGWTVIKTSAKSGFGVEKTFQTLAYRILEG